MVTFCLEFGTAQDQSVIIHKLSCENIDHATLLGMGRLAALGDFINSFSALSSAKSYHRGAARCVDCCITDVIPPPVPHRQMHIETF